MLPEFNIVVAVDNHMGISRAGQIPWHLAGDLKQFKKLTTSTSSPDKKNLVLMGRKTWDTLPETYKPLPDRINCVLTRSTDFVLPENTASEATGFSPRRGSKEPRAVRASGHVRGVANGHLPRTSGDPTRWPYGPRAMKTIEGRPLAFKVHSFKQALLACQGFKDPEIERIFVIGGGAVYEEAVSYAECRKIYMTQIMQDFHCDVFFPSILSDFKKVHQSPSFREAGLEYSFSEYVRIDSIRGHGIQPVA